MAPKPIPTNTDIPKGYRLSLPEEQRQGQSLFINDLWVKPQPTGLDTLRLTLPGETGASGTRSRPRIIDESQAPVSQSEVLTQDIEKRERALQQTGAVLSAVPGMQAAAAQVPTGDATSAVWQAVGTGVAGAAGGALVGAQVGAAGGPIGMGLGAAIGGVSGLIMGGIQAYTGHKAQKQARREANKQAQRIQEMNRKAVAQQRADINEQLRYNRRVNALQSRWDAMEKARGHVNELISGNQQLKNLFINQGR